MHVSGRNIKVGRRNIKRGGAIRIKKIEPPNQLFSNAQLPAAQSLNPQRFTNVPALRITEKLNGMSIIERRDKKKGNIKLVL